MDIDDSLRTVFWDHLWEGLPNEEKLGKLRLTVDTPEDFALIRAIFEELHPLNPEFVQEDILQFLERRADLPELNQRIQAKAYR